MKKLLISFAATLLCLLAYSQEADDLGSYAEVTVIPRLDVNPTYNSDNSDWGLNHGNSSIYTLFEGSASEHFSWTVANHWIQAGGDYGWPYTYLGHSDSTNWLDYCMANLTFSNWTFTLGKDLVSTGGFEYEDWDWDIYPSFSSPLAEGLSCYQWGGKVSYTTASEMSTFSAQMTASPYGEHPFSSGMWAYSAQWRGEYGWFSNIWSVSALQYDRTAYDVLVSLGQQASFGDWTFIFDWNNSYGFNDEYTLAKGNTFQARLTYAPSERYDIALRAYYSTPRDSEIYSDHWNLGTVFEFYPLRDTQNLRLHAFLNYDSLLTELTLGVGVRYNLVINVW